MGLGPVLVSTALNAHAGGLDLVTFASSIAELWAFAAFGYLAGVLLPRVLAAFAASAAAFFGVVYSGLSPHPTALVFSFGVVAGLHANPLVTLFRVVFFLSAVLLLTSAAAQWLRRGTPRATIGLIAVMALMLLPLPVVSVAADNSAPQLVRKDGARPVCDSAGSVQVCVHPARESMLPALTNVVNRLMLSLGAARRNFVMVVDATLWPKSRPGVVILQIQGDDRSAWISEATQDLARKLSGAETCQIGITQAKGQNPSPATVAMSVGIWLARQAGTDGSQVGNDPQAIHLADRLSDLPARVVQRELGRHLVAIRTCRGTQNDL